MAKEIEGADGHMLDSIPTIGGELPRQRQPLPGVPPIHHDGDRGLEFDITMPVAPQPAEPNAEGKQS